MQQFEGDVPQKSLLVGSLDFIESDDPAELGLLIAADSTGFLYVVQLSKKDTVDDQLIFMSHLQSASTSELAPITACKWLSWKDRRFAIMNADGDFSIYEVAINKEDPLALDEVTVAKVLEVNTFNALSHNFQFCDINQLGSQAI